MSEWNACETAGELIPEFLAGRLDPQSEARVREHLEGCAECRSRANAVSLLQETPVPIPDPERWDGFVGGVVEAAARPSRRRSRIALGVVAALAAAALVVFSWVRLSDVPRLAPPDLDDLAQEIVKLPESQTSAWTAGLTPTSSLSAGVDASGLSDAELDELAVEVDRT